MKNTKEVSVSTAHTSTYLSVRLIYIFFVNGVGRVRSFVRLFNLLCFFGQLLTRLQQYCCCTAESYIRHIFGLRQPVRRVVWCANEKTRAKGIDIHTHTYTRTHTHTRTRNCTLLFAQPASPLPLLPSANPFLYTPSSVSDLASLRMWRQAIAVFDNARAEGLPLTSSTYTTMINALSKGGRYVMYLACRLFMYVPDLYHLCVYVFVCMCMFMFTTKLMRTTKLLSGNVCG